MADTTTWLAVVASVLASGGIGTQVVAYFRARNDIESKKTLGADEFLSNLTQAHKDLADRQSKTEQRVDAFRHERDEARDSLAKINRKHGKLESDHKNLMMAQSALQASNTRLQREYELISFDYKMLKSHVAQVEQRERKLRRKLNIDEDTGQHILEPKIPRPPPLPRETVYIHNLKDDVDPKNTKKP